MTNMLYLPTPQMFGINVEQCAEIEKKIMATHEKHAPIRIPPPILSKQLKELMIQECTFATQMIFSVVDRIFSGNYLQFTQELGLQKYLEDFIPMLTQAHWLERAQKFYRPDLLLTKTGIKMVENNIDTPLGGIACTDALIRQFQQAAGINSEILEKKKIHYHSITHVWLHTLDKLLEQKKKVIDRKPVFFSALDSSQANPDDDFAEEDYNNYIRNHGYDVFVGPIGDLEVKNNKVLFNGAEIDIIYNNFGFTEFIEHKQSFSLLKPLIEADEKNQVLFLLPPITMLFDNKAIFSFLTDDKYKKYYSVAEFSRLKKLIPYTKIVTNESKKYCLDEQKNLVLKPSFEFGGKDIFFGAEYTANEWLEMINVAITKDLSSVVQEVVHSQTIYGSNQSALNVCLGPFFLDGKFAGCFYREANIIEGKKPVINVTRGNRFSAAYFEQ